MYDMYSRLYVIHQQAMLWREYAAWADKNIFSKSLCYTKFTEKLTVVSIIIVFIATIKTINHTWNSDIHTVVLNLPVQPKTLQCWWNLTCSIISKPSIRIMYSTSEVDNTCDPQLVLALAWLLVTEHCSHHHHLTRYIYSQCMAVYCYV